MDIAVIVISAHLKLESILKYSDKVKNSDKVVFLTTQYVFDNERIILNKIHNIVEYICFADLMTDKDGEKCDIEAFKPYLDSKNLKLKSMYSYFKDLTRMKNELLQEKVDKIFSPSLKLIACDDLGIDSDVWKAAGYQPILCEYFAKRDVTEEKYRFKKIFQKNLIKKIAKKFNLNYPENLYVAHYKDYKILFHGHLARTGYRINLTFKQSQIENFKHWLIKVLYVIFKIKVERKKTINLTTLHEYGNYAYYEMMDVPEFHNYLFQDGYLPPNDCCKYLFFYGRHTKFYTWDKLGQRVFAYHGLESKILPFRNIFAIPKPNFKPIKKILCVSSGAGDWTAIKNRSDEDKTVAAFVQMAKRFPEIEFVYRCHPSWVSPTIQGVNSIQRLVEYFDWLGLPNLKVSSNIPSFFDKNGNAIVSHKRSSLESDLEESDFVFGVHSISMIDGAMKQIPFASVNLSGRRNLWKGISDLGFPHCENENEIADVIQSVMLPGFQDKYLRAIDLYNKLITEN